MMRRRFCIGFFGFSSFLAAPAVAQGTDRALAETLFNDAKRLADQGKFDQACPKFDDAYAAYPGTGTLFNAAGCYERAGKSATAWARFGEALAAARRDGSEERVKFAEEHRAALEPKLSHVVLEVSDAVRAIAGLEVKVGARSIPPSAFNLPIPVDPGKVVVVASAPGHVPFQAEATLGEAADKRLQIDKLDAASSDAGAPAGAANPDGPPAAAPAAAPGGSDPGAGRRTAGFVIGGVGVIGLGVGVVFNVMARSVADKVDEDCLPSSASGYCEVTDPDQLNARQNNLNQANSNALVSYISFGVGAAALATGIVLVVTAGKGNSEKTAHIAPSIAPGQLGISIGGTL